MLCLEEVHGHHLEIKSCFAVWLPGWTVFASSALRADGSDNCGAGGVAIALCPAIVAGAMLPIDHKILVAGRCNSVTISFPKPSNLLHSICIRYICIYIQIYIWIFIVYLVIVRCAFVFN